MFRTTEIRTPLAGYRRVVRRACAGALAAAFIFGSVGDALAQSIRYGDTQFPTVGGGGLTRRFPAVAYAEANDAYLVAWGVIQLEARFVSSEGIPLGAAAPLNTDGVSRQAGAVRVACGANINVCLITWLEESPSRIVGRLVRYNGGNIEFLSTRFPISETGAPKLSSSAPSVAYSPVASEFLVSWTETNTNVYAQRVSGGGVPVGGVITIAATGLWEGLPAVTYNSAQDEYFVAFYFEPGLDAVGGVRVKPGTGEVLGHDPATGNITLYSGIFEKYPDIVYNSAANEYLAITWGSGFTVHGQRVNGSGQPIGGVLNLAVGGGDGIGVGYSAAANRYLATYQHPDAPEAWASGIASDGTPEPRFQATFSGGANARQPQAAGSSQAARFLVVSTFQYSAVMSQMVQSGASAPPPAPEPCTFSINPASISIGGAATNGTLFVTASRSDCAWEAAGNGFITFQNGTGRVGSGGVAFNIAANPSSSSRVGETTVAGKTFTVTQGPACVFNISPTSISIGAGATSGSVVLSATAGCGWTASSHNAFMTFTGSKSGAGSATLPFSIAANPSTIARTGSATIAGRTLSIVQGGAPFNAAARARENARADFDGNGDSDLLLQNLSGGSLGAWLLDGIGVAATPSLSHGLVDYINWRVMGTGDFNGDGLPDIILQHLSEGWIYVWYMQGTTRAGGTYTSVHRLVDVRWRIAAVGDMNLDGKPDIVWQHPDGWLAVWLMDGVTRIASIPLTPGNVQDVQWQIAGMGDFNGDGRNDLVWRHTGRGDLGVWFMDGFTRIGFSPLQPGVVANQDWRIAAIIDANGDNTPDLVWQNATQGSWVIWLMIGTERIAAPTLTPAVPANWVISGAK